MTFQQYLDAKRTVDDRALNRRVLGQFECELSDGIRILEIGGGTGAMLERLVSWKRLPKRVQYTVLDIDPENVATARERLVAYGFEPEDETLRLDDGNHQLGVTFEVADAVEFVEKTDEQWDALIGHAVVDLFDLETALPAFLSALAPGGVCYFPITFDGGSFFHPPNPLDEQVERLYHRNMGGGRGFSDAGRRLLADLPGHEAEILAAGSSDWVVYPRDGSYPADEATFLNYILETVASVVGNDRDIDSDAFAEWFRTRTRQVERGELTYIAHQIDVLATRIR
ncbi:class I SAM-dependent methyltransferase [Haladaptatus caseinilyticus]|uniref:class I SAM-dependent methyltransferase n=1 Tax=Haladaptatus caseinilyticus TaxID=2993314 RepID=UPI00224B0113|nr:class I SAM-dependent methyltransferase [Haladaptatus caseinilyticus]